MIVLCAISRKIGGNGYNLAVRRLFDDINRFTGVRIAKVTVCREPIADGRPGVFQQGAADPASLKNPALDVMGFARASP